MKHGSKIGLNLKKNYFTNCRNSQFFGGVKQAMPKLWSIPPPRYTAH